MNKIKSTHAEDVLFRLMKNFALILLSLFTFSATADETPNLTDAEFSAAFQCPENLPNDDARDGAVRSFLAWVQKNHGDWTIQKAIEFRVGLLEAHHCTVTLSNMRKNQQMEDQKS